MTDTILDVLTESLQVTLLVLFMMTLVDIINVWTRGKLALLLHTSSGWKQYVVTSVIGAVPGCVGAFAGVSLYMHGMVSFGALAGGMLAASGDEAFVMLAMFPKTAILIFVILAAIGISSGRLIDFVIKKFNIKTCVNCQVPQYHERHEGYKHYLKEHVWDHIIKKHLWKIFLWTSGALLLLSLGFAHYDLHKIASEYSLLILIASAFIGLIPESGPHLIFVTMFAQGLIPFSVLLTSTMVQDGHGLLPMLSYSLRDSIYIKLFNLALGLFIGLIIYFLGF